jgi:hypothetical protein
MGFFLCSRGENLVMKMQTTEVTAVLLTAQLQAHDDGRHEKARLLTEC